LDPDPLAILVADVQVGLGQPDGELLPADPGRDVTAADLP